MRSLYVLSTRHLKPATISFLAILMHRQILSRKRRKMLVVVVSAMFFSLTSLAQAPYQFSFQGVARDAEGKVVNNANVTVRTKIHKDSPNGTVIFTETQVVQTNASGIFNLVVGGLNGQLTNVDWGSDNCFFQTEVDVTGGANFVDLGTTQLKSVPYALASRQWINNVPIVQTGTVGSGPTLNSIPVGSNLIWYPKKAAFRVGSLTLQTLGNESYIGNNSFAVGQDVLAQADHSVAIGSLANAAKLESVAIGSGTATDGKNAVAIGHNAQADGESSVAIGENVVSKSNAGISLGSNNNNSDTKGALLPADRIFQLGNGASSFTRSNAITVLRNGNVGIGNNVLAPEFMMDLGGRMRIKHNGQTAGIHFNNSANNIDGFVGMMTDDAVGFWVNNDWRFWVNSSNAYVNGSIVNTSDRRLKEKIKSFSSSLPLLHTLNGYHYYWKNKQQGSEMQTGLIAQEVEQRFPELVVTGKDGYKAVNYLGLIPHLIEAVKELDKKTEEINALKKELAQMKELSKKVMYMEASMKVLLQGSTLSDDQTSAK